MPVLSHRHIMMKKNSLKLPTALLFSAVLAAGCGSSDSSTPDGNGGTTNPTDPTSPTPSTDTSALSHAGKPLPQNSVNPATTALYSDIGRAKAEALPDNLAVVYEVIENHGGDAFPSGSGTSCSQLAAEYSSCSVTNLHIKDAAGVLNDGNWKLYFHSIRRILRVDSDEFSVSLVNGDLNYLEPTEAFTGFDGSVKTIGLVTEFNHLIESDFMPRYWLVSDDGTVTMINNTDDDTDESGYSVAISGDNAKSYNGEPTPIASASTRFEANADVESAASNLTALEIQSRIIPRPESVVVGTGALDIGSGFSFAGTDLSAESVAALQARQTQFMSTAAGTALSATIDASLAVNSYTLDVTAAGIAISGADETALFNGAQSLLALVQPGLGTIPVLSVQDAPRFTFRGMHVDVARNFHSVESLESLMDQMAAYKLNKLHIHLSDDEGWRLDIPSLPELTSVGGRRAFALDGEGNVSEAASLMPQLGSGPGSDNQGSGFYTSDQFVSLLRYAAARKIDIIPEFDMPAHARAAVVAMRARAVNLGDADDINVRVDDPADTSRYLTIQHYDDGILNPCIPGTYAFIGTVINDVKAMYDEAGVTLDIFHMGGDEARNVFTGGGFQDVNASDKVSYRGDITRSDWEFPWENSPACNSLIAENAGIQSREVLQPYFVKEVAKLVNDAGIPAMYAYQDIYDELDAGDLATQRAGVGYWERIATDAGYKNINEFANRGYETVVSVPDFLYFDFPQEVNPEERGYYWATRYTDTRKVFGFAPENLPQNAETSVNREGLSWSATGETNSPAFLGMQGQLWSETVRTPEQFDYMLFPRVIALAERAWSKGSWELDYAPGQTFSGDTNLVDKNALNEDYASFAAALAEKELSKLDAAGIQYRISVPGASTAAGQLSMNSDLPGLPLEYSTDGTSFLPYEAGASANGVVAIRARSADGQRIGRTETLTQ
ncbi:family 20 glycosylhydrolase [Granulosicoccus antarcticus]|uniref:beta-N-acetylhexosaminidase n=1 Tax=Granulosicoccus antarcticus IMCC3135 TaxID=1192854 RepID=A0A2Z2NV82_9GAMM|nr:family 20 glycosylhydrolase [Granulosicoccus antarcticus]ASJ75153.1 N,N'-diacetylchitobiase [Granulosicoccus antarcticus IMCC3135]